MSYMHIDNLYKNQDILAYKECYALEKIHGTSAHISYNKGEVKVFAGGGNHQSFLGLFNIEALKAKFDAMCLEGVCIVYGENYGGKQQGMSGTYGKEPKFIVFEVKIGDYWLNIPKAEVVAKELGLEFVSYKRIPCEIEAINTERDTNSVQAIRNGITEPKMREGIVLHPIEEYTKNNGTRVIAKHKRPEFSETKTPREISPEALQKMEDAKKIAEEWVTAQRLNHVIGDIEIAVENIGKIIPFMIEDIKREAEDEIVPSIDAMKQIGTATALLVKRIVAEEVGKCT